MHFGEFMLKVAFIFHREKDRLQKKLVKSCDGMILWAELMIKELEDRPWDVDHVLNYPPRGLRAVYEVIFSKVVNVGSDRSCTRVLRF